MRRRLLAKCGARMSLQPTASCDSSRYAAFVSAKPEHAAAMLTLGCSAKRSTNLTSRRFRRASPSSAAPTSSSAQLTAHPVLAYQALHLLSVPALQIRDVGNGMG